MIITSLLFGQHGRLTALGPGYWPSKIIVIPRSARADNDFCQANNQSLGLSTDHVALIRDVIVILSALLGIVEVTALVSHEYSSSYFL